MLQSNNTIKLGDMALTQHQKSFISCVSDNRRNPQELTREKKRARKKPCSKYATAQHGRKMKEPGNVNVKRKVGLGKHSGAWRELEGLIQTNICIFDCNLFAS